MRRPDDDWYSDEQMERLVYSILIAALLLCSIVLVGTWVELAAL